jgi:phosphoribosylamine--glycine ligase
MLPDKPINILVVGGGGREHAICWKLAQSPRAAAVFCAPGNGGTAGDTKIANVDIKVTEFEKLADFSCEKSIDLVVIGPDNPLADGIVDFLQDRGLRVFGPVKEAAKLEWSKAFAKQFMLKHGLPTARHITAGSFDDAIAKARQNDWARVVKVDGLALGKGVFVCDSLPEVEEALATVFEQKAFGNAGDLVLLEERLNGEEMSLLFFCDGKSLVTMPACQDHKRRFDGDVGPNTGGMGVYSPVPMYDRCAYNVRSDILKPLEKALRADKSFNFCGILYAGIMVTPENKPYFLEFNARFGDPETQALLPLLKSDLLEILWACTDGSLHETAVQWQKDASCCVVAAADTYPTSSSKGEAISIGALPQDCFVFHAGTKLQSGDKEPGTADSGTENSLVTDGGRVLAVTAVAPNMQTARTRAYKALEAIHFKGMDYRTDIARRAVKECLSS